MLAKIKKNKNRIKSIKNTVFLIFLAVLFFGLLGFSIISNINVERRRTQYIRRIEELKKEIKSAEEQKKELEKDLNRAGSKEYLEEVARKQFGLKAPGEEVVVVSKENEEDKKTAEESSLAKDAEDKARNIWDPRTWWQWITGGK